MQPSLTIGDFSRATHLSVKTLRHYHQVGLLEPADVDSYTGYRRYTTEQIPTAQVIRRFRALDMPLDDIQAVLAAPDPQTRNEFIAAHLNRLEDELARTRDAVASLRDLLDPSVSGTPAAIGHRRAEAAPAAAISEVIDIRDAMSWHHGALGELYATLAAQGVPTTGPAGGIFSNELFSHECGQATIFLPCARDFTPIGRVSPLVVPAAELATIVHAGPETGIDLAYGALATYVTRHALAVEGPIREYYLVGRNDTTDESQWRTEICWPVFLTGTNV